MWTWDITKLATTEKGVFLRAYVIHDLFSPYVVGWLVAPRECNHLAATLFAEAIVCHGVEPGLIVHADRGSAMKSDTRAQLLADLGASRSFSRPRVSNDNAFTEAHFKTLKYQPDYPGRFSSISHARAWLQEFFGWYNDEHHHTGLALFTAADVFHGRIDEVAATRQRALDAAYGAHPERFPHGPPTVRHPPAKVEINPSRPRPPRRSRSAATTPALVRLTARSPPPRRAPRPKWRDRASRHPRAPTSPSLARSRERLIARHSLHRIHHAAVSNALTRSDSDPQHLLSCDIAETLFGVS